MNKVDISLILACYNEGPTFGVSIDKIIDALRKTKKRWEIIFVEDKSTDETKTAIEKLIRQIKNSKVIYHRENQGRGKSVSDGLKAAKGEICGYLDVDLEVSENYIPIFIEEIKNGADMAVGKRYYEKNLDSLLRFIASRVYSFLVKSIINIPVSDTEAGYKFFRSGKIIPILSKVKAKHWFWDTEICARAYWMGFKISEVPVIFNRRHDKKSTLKLIPDSIDYFKNLIAFRREVPKTFK